MMHKHFFSLQVIAIYNNGKKECINSAEVSSGKITLTKHDCNAVVTLTVECLNVGPMC